jgi:hypothetical protein
MKPTETVEGKSNYQSEEDQEVIATLSPLPSIEPTPSPTPVVIGILTEEEKRADEITYEVLKLREYINENGDDYSYVRLKEMYEAGEITREDYTLEDEYNAEGFLAALGDVYTVYSDILNQMASFAEKGYLELSLFNEQEARDSEEDIVKVVRKWNEDPSSENTYEMEIALLSLKDPGEISYVGAWIFGGSNYGNISREDTEYDFITYVKDVIIDKENNRTLSNIIFEAQDILYYTNNTSNEEKEPK